MPIPETGYIYLVMMITFPLWSILSVIKRNYEQAQSWAIAFILALIAFLNSVTMMKLG
jgi:multisubunit Na+/H+ antiporter MnhF subunit